MVQPWPPDRLRSSPDANVGCSGAPARGAGGEPAVAILTRRERRVQPPSAVSHPRAPPLRSSPDANVGCSDALPLTSVHGTCGPKLRSSPDANVGCSVCRGWTRQLAESVLRSSPDANVGCSRAVSVHSPRRIPVAILTRRERRVRAGRGRRGARRIGGCDPHPTRTSGAASRPRRRTAATRRCDTSPDANVGCSGQPPRPRHRGAGVAILTRRERRVQPLTAPRRSPRLQRCDPHPTRTSGAASVRPWPAQLRTLLRSSPDANVGCSRRRPRRGIAACDSGCDPHPTRTSGAAGVTRNGRPVAAGLRSSPDANVGCSGIAGDRDAPTTCGLRSSPDANVGCSARSRSGRR